MKMRGFQELEMLLILAFAELGVIAKVINAQNCGPCLSGETCESYENKNVPRFLQTSATVNVTSDPDPSRVVFRAEAIDRDQRACSADLAEPCPCAELQYFLVDVDEVGVTVLVDAESGDVFLIGVVLPGKEFYVELGVRNPEDDEYGSMSLHFYVSDNRNRRLKNFPDTLGPKRENLRLSDPNTAKSSSGLDKFGDDVAEPVLERQKRSTTIAPVSVVEFNVSPGDNNSMIALGDVKHIEVQIVFPENETIVDSIEIFVMDNDTSLLAVGNVGVSTIGSCLSLDYTMEEINANSNKIKANDTETNVNHKLYAEVDLDFGSSVTNDHTCADGTVLQEVSITVQYDIIRVVHDGSDEHNGTEAIVAFGIEYDNSTRVWIVSHSYTILDDVSNVTEVLNQNRYTSYNISYSSDVVIGTPAYFDIDIYVPNLYVDMTIEVFAPFNVSGMIDPIDEDVVSICSVHVIDTGDNYKYYDTDYPQLTRTASDSGATNIQGSLTLGKLLNIGGDMESTDVDANDRISVRVVVDLPADSVSSLAVGQEMWFGIATKYGNSQIWLANIAANVTDVVSDVDTETWNDTVPIVPTFSHTLLNRDIGPEDVLVYEVTMVSPSYGIHEYKAEAFSTVNFSNPSPLDLKVCGIRVAHYGPNYACGLTEKLSTKYERSELGYTDKVNYDYGHVVNSGASSSDDSNTLKFEVYYEMVDERLSDVTDNSSSEVTAGIDLSGKIIWVGQQTASLYNSSLANATYFADIPNSQLTSVQLVDEFVSVETGQWLGVTTDIYYYPGLKLDNQIITMSSSDENDVASLEFCGIRFVSAGSNLPCVDDGDIQKALTIESRSAAAYNDFATANIGSVTNVGALGATEFYEDERNRLRVQVLYRLNEGNVSMAAFNDTYAYLGLSLSDNQKWVGIMPVVDNFTIVDNPAAQKPEILLPDTPTVEGGQLLLLKVTLVPPVYTPGRYQIRFSSTSTDLSTCDVRISRVGSQFPCGIEAKNVTLGVNDAVIDLGIVASYDGRVTADQNITSDPDYSIDVVFYVLELSEGANFTIPYDIEVIYHGVTDSVSGQIDVIDPNRPLTNGTGISPEFYRVDLGNNTSVDNSAEFMSGEVLRLILAITFDTSFTTSSISIHFVAPLQSGHDWDILSVSILDDVLGSPGFPCMKTLPDNYTSYNVTDSVNGGPDLTSEIALDMGPVCMLPPPTSQQTEFVVTFEAYARMRRSSICNTNTSLGVGVSINDREIYATVGDFTRVTDPTLYGGLTSLTAPDVSTSVQSPPNADLNSLINITINVELPENVGSTHLVIDVKQSLDGGSFVINKLELTDADANLLGAQRDVPEIEMTVLENFPWTRQAKHVRFDFGTVTNTGLVPFSGRTLTFTLEVLAVDTVHASDQTLQIDVDFNGGQVMESSNVQIDLDRTDFDKPELIVNATTNCSGSITSGESLFITYNIKHDNTSTAVASNVKVMTFLPPLMKMTEIIEVTIGGNVSGDVEILLSRAAIEIANISMFAEMEVTVKLDVVSLNKTITNRDITIPYRVSYTHLNMTDGNTYTGTRGVLTDLPACSAYLDHTAAPVCTTVSDISSGISVNQITAAPVASGSSVSDVITANKMLFGTREPYASYDPMRYIEIDFLSLHYITQVVMESSVAGTFSVIILTSSDGIGWNAKPETSVASGVAVSVNKEGSHLRVQFVSPSDLDINIVVSGCDQGSPSREVKPKPAGFKLAPRQFMVTNEHLFVCDSKPVVNHESTCSAKILATGKWRVMDKRIHNLLGFDSGMRYLLAMSKTGGYMMTRNGGTKWSSISPKHFSTFNLDVLPVDVPWDVNLSSYPNQLSPDNVYNFTGKNQGMFEYAGGVDTLVSDWLTV